jgi:hypothetical protein
MKKRSHVSQSRENKGEPLLIKVYERKERKNERRLIVREMRVDD